MLTFIIGLSIGATIGIFLMAIITIGKIADMETVIAVLKEKL